MFLEGPKCGHYGWEAFPGHWNSYWYPWPYANQMGRDHSLLQCLWKYKKSHVENVHREHILGEVQIFGSNSTLLSATNGSSNQRVALFVCLEFRQGLKSSAWLEKTGAWGDPEWKFLRDLWRGLYGQQQATEPSLSSGNKGSGLGE